MSIKKIGRREALGVMGSAASAAIAIGCGSSPTNPTATSSSGTTTTESTNAACAVTPSETAGPYASLTDIFRSDIREGKSGTPLTLTVKVVNVNGGCAAVPNANVEVWHCDSSGNYSEYGTQYDPELSAWHSNHQQQRRSDLHHDLSRLVPGAGHAYSSRGHDERGIAEDHSDCISGGHQQHRLPNRCVCVEGTDSDVDIDRWGFVA